MNKQKMVEEFMATFNQTVRRCPTWLPPDEAEGGSEMKCLCTNGLCEPGKTVSCQDCVSKLAAERNALAEQVRELRELAIWMTGCGYDFTQHEYFQAKKSLLSCGPPRNEAEGGR